MIAGVVVSEQLGRELLLPRTGLVSAVLLLVVNGLLGGVMCHLLEDPGLPKANNPFDVMYWTFVTGTSVGYGDYAPATSNGEIATVFYALFAMQSAGKRLWFGR